MYINMYIHRYIMHTYVYINCIGIWHKPLLQNDGGLVVDWPIAHCQFFHIHHFPLHGTCCGPVGFPQHRIAPISRHFSTKDTLTTEAIRRHGRGAPTKEEQRPDLTLTKEELEMVMKARQLMVVLW